MANPLEPLSRQSSASIIAGQIRNGIAMGLFRPGQQLSEAQISAQLGVSRGLLREAMQRLVQEGLLRSERFRGLFVIELDETDVRDIYVTREGIERAAVRVILERGERDFNGLERIVRKMQQIADGSRRGSMVELDLEFHLALVEMSGSPRLKRAMQSLIVETAMCLRGREAARYANMSEQLAEHEEILTALREQNEELALALITKHMTVTAKTLVALSTPEPEPASD